MVNNNKYWIYSSDGVTPTFSFYDSNLFGGINYELNINPDEDLTVGTVASAKVTFVTDSTNITSSSVGRMFDIRTSFENTSSWNLLGTFKISSIEKTSNNKYKVTAYDLVANLDKDIRSYLYTEGLFPITVGNLFAGICDQCGLSAYSTSFTNSTTNIPTNPFGGNTISARTIMSFIAAVAGGYIIAMPSITGSKLKIGVATLSSSASSTITTNDYKTVTFADFTVPTINNIRVAMSDTDVGVTYPNPVVSGEILDIPYNGIFYNNGDVETVRSKLQNIYNTVHNYANYTPYEIEMFSDFNLIPGNKININWTDRSVTPNVSGTFTSYIFSKKITNTGVVLSCTGNPNRVLDVNLVDTEVQALVGKYNTISNTVNQHTQTLGDLSTDTSTTFKIDANGVYITKTVGGVEETVEIDGASVNATRIDASEINTADLNMSGRIAWTDLVHGSGTGSVDPHLTGDIYRSDVVPQTLSRWTNVNGAYWYLTAIPAGITAYNSATTYVVNNLCYVDTDTRNYYICTATTTGSFNLSCWEVLKEGYWYTWNMQYWRVTDTPYYIKSTYIDGARLLSPTIEGNEINVLNGSFNVKDAAGSVSYGSMGIGNDIDTSGVNYTGVKLSSVDTDTASQVGYLLMTENGIRLTFDSPFNNNTYSIFLKSDGGYYEENVGGTVTTVKLGSARFS